MKDGIFVVMTHHNHDEYTHQALESLKETTENCGVLVIDDGSEKPFKPPLGYAVLRNDPARGVIAAWNQAYEAWTRLWDDLPHLVITNNDVIFMPGWSQPLMRAFERRVYCGIVGPLTNQPGHQEMQRALDIGDDLDAMRFAAEHDPGDRPDPISISYVNGFCFMLRRDRTIPIMEPEDVMFRGLPIGNHRGQIVEFHKHYGGEDDYQARMRLNSLVSCYAPDSYVYHYKDVSMESHKRGRMGLKKESLPRMEDAVCSP